MKLKVCAAVLFLAAAIPAVSQVAPAATESPLRLKVGVGFSDFNGDFYNGRLTGGTIWADCSPCGLPKILHGIGIEAEARGMRSPNTPPTVVGAQQEAGAGGGPIYFWNRYRNFKPYAKFLVDYSAMDFYDNNPSFHRITQVSYAPGGGFDYHAYRHIWARADYEYQIWPKIFRGGDFILDPQGITVGLAWQFGPSRR